MRRIAPLRQSIVLKQRRNIVRMFDSPQLKAGALVMPPMLDTHGKPRMEASLCRPCNEQFRLSRGQICVEKRVADGLNWRRVNVAYLFRAIGQIGLGQIFDASPGILKSARADD